MDVFNLILSMCLCDEIIFIFAYFVNLHGHVFKWYFYHVLILFTNYEYEASLDRISEASFGSCSKEVKDQIPFQSVLLQLAALLQASHFEI